MAKKQKIFEKVKYCNKIEHPVKYNKISMAMTDISNPMAHQLPLHNHRSGLVQPSLVMNHHLEMDCHTTDIRISKFVFQCEFI